MVIDVYAYDGVHSVSSLGSIFHYYIVVLI